MVDPDGFALENDRVSYISFRLCPGLVRLPRIVINHFGGLVKQTCQPINCSL